MRVFRISLAAIVFAAFAILAHTQTRPAANPAAPATRPGAAAPANIAVIDSIAFRDEKTGITRVMAAMKGLETKFQPLRNELRGMRDRLNTMRADIDKKRSIQDARMTAQQIEEADRLELQIKRKAEDAQVSYQKESLAALEPLQQDIATALRAYSQAKGISLLIDLNRVPVIYAASTLDITKEFIADYNRTHPATGAPARP
ncbi:MAG TPA: OmpH family outer membrane protein [Pyrinomonadaceae bacterium]|nr:OmpH family outer membrane protein [Pyrinomonadaceae bacterium]